MNVASLELCKELYELSGWYDTSFVWSRNSLANRPLTFKPDAVFDDPPAYDLGFLIRKMPRRVKLRTYSNGYAVQWQKNGAVYRNQERMFEAESPEDCLCMLAIFLLKEGIIK